MKRAYVFLADGFEEVEAVAPIDYLRRAGADVSVVGVTGLLVTSARQLAVTCDLDLVEVQEADLPDLVVLPGGMKGSRNLAASRPLKALVTRMMGEGRLVGAICAAPAVALGAWGLLEGRKWTCYPGEEEALGVRVSDARVVVDNNLITSRAAGTAGEFALALVEALFDAATAESVRKAVLARP